MQFLVSFSYMHHRGCHRSTDYLHCKKGDSRYHGLHCMDIQSMSSLYGLHKPHCPCYRWTWCDKSYWVSYLIREDDDSQFCWVEIIWQLPKGWNACALIISFQLLDSITLTGCRRSVKCLLSVSKRESWNLILQSIISVCPQAHLLSLKFQSKRNLFHTSLLLTPPPYSAHSLTQTQP